MKIMATKLDTKFVDKTSAECLHTRVMSWRNEGENIVSEDDNFYHDNNSSFDVYDDWVIIPQIDLYSEWHIVE